MGAADLFIHSLSHPFPQPWIMQPALRLVQKKHRARGCRYPTRMALGFGGLGRHSEGTRRPRKASGKEGGWEASRRGWCAAQPGWGSVGVGSRGMRVLKALLRG